MFLLRFSILFFCAGIVLSRQWSSGVKIDVTDFGTERKYCEYPLTNVANGPSLKILPGSAFDTLDCYHCVCTYKGLSCQGTGFYGDEITGPSKCILVADGCRAKFVLKSDNKTECFSNVPIASQLPALSSIQDDQMFTQEMMNNNAMPQQGLNSIIGTFQQNLRQPMQAMNHQTTLPLGTLQPAAFATTPNQNMQRQVIQRYSSSASPNMGNMDAVLGQQMPWLQELLAKAISGGIPQGVSTNIQTLPAGTMERRVYVNQMPYSAADLNNLAGLLTPSQQLSTNNQLQALLQKLSADAQLPSLIQKTVTQSSKYLPASQRFPVQDTFDNYKYKVPPRDAVPTRTPQNQQQNSAVNSEAIFVQSQTSGSQPPPPQAVSQRSQTVTTTTFESNAGDVNPGSATREVVQTQVGNRATVPDQSMPVENQGFNSGMLVTRQQTSQVASGMGSTNENQRPSFDQSELRSFPFQTRVVQTVESLPQSSQSSQTQSVQTETKVIEAAQQTSGGAPIIQKSNVHREVIAGQLPPVVQRTQRVVVQTPVIQRQGFVQVPVIQTPNAEDDTKISLGVKTSYHTPGEYGGHSRLGKTPVDTEVVQEIPINSNTGTGSFQRVVQMEQTQMPGTAGVVIRQTAPEVVQTRTVTTTRNVSQQPLVLQGTRTVSTSGVSENLLTENMDSKPAFVPIPDGASSISLGLKTTIHKPSEYGGHSKYGAKGSTTEVIQTVQGDGAQAQKAEASAEPFARFMAANSHGHIGQDAGQRNPTQSQVVQKRVIQSHVTGGNMGQLTPSNIMTKTTVLSDGPALPQQQTVPLFQPYPGSQQSSMTSQTTQYESQAPVQTVQRVATVQQSSSSSSSSSGSPVMTNARVNSQILGNAVQTPSGMSMTSQFKVPVREEVMSYEPSVVRNPSLNRPHPNAEKTQEVVKGSTKIEMYKAPAPPETKNNANEDKMADPFLSQPIEFNVQVNPPSPEKMAIAQKILNKEAVDKHVLDRVFSDGTENSHSPSDVIDQSSTGQGRLLSETKSSKASLARLQTEEPQALVSSVNKFKLPVAVEAQSISAHESARNMAEPVGLIKGRFAYTNVNKYKVPVASETRKFQLGEDRQSYAYSPILDRSAIASARSKMMMFRRPSS